MRETVMQIIREAMGEVTKKQDDLHSGLEVLEDHIVTMAHAIPDAMKEVKDHTSSQLATVKGEVIEKVTVSTEDTKSTLQKDVEVMMDTIGGIGANIEEMRHNNNNLQLLTMDLSQKEQQKETVSEIQSTTVLEDGRMVDEEGYEVVTRRRRQNKPPQ